MSRLYPFAVVLSSPSFCWCLPITRIPRRSSTPHFTTTLRVSGDSFRSLSSRTSTNFPGPALPLTYLTRVHPSR
ncbi:hypothetical protein L227DRAFT_31898 [Lentinus tigrinus ALCF2SS1-6]|uniref:REJ domain-containing protein n=1 Tax=Lentinus tigrinus ALCF2SS1-6 TaxID=1328759 RepID=A0A5C2SGB3_9APHY|nr:hypothetical protein L227DRAFT_31898 [Lentinus tigrinus ALCF2SS1-6]